MRRLRMLLAALAASLLLPGCLRPRYVTEVERWTPRSELVFVGTIRQTRTSTLDLKRTDELAVVSVDDVLGGAKVFQSQRGRLVTVRLADPGSAKVGQRRLFFARGWRFGSSIGLVEVAGTGAPSAKDMPRARAAVERASAEKADAELALRLERSQLVVTGRVVSVRKVDVPPTLGEHDPDWYEADIRIERVLRGRHDAAVVTIVFPNSTDVVWYRVPKYRPDVEGVWLLRAARLAGLKVERLTTLDREDFQPKAALPRIEKLLAKP